MHSSFQTLSSYKKNIWFEISIYIILCMIGWISIFSIEYNQKTFNIFRFFFENKNYTRQFFWIVCSLMFGFVIIFTNGKVYSSISYASYFIGLALMILTIFIGTNFRGSHSWLSIFGLFRVQVAQFMIVFTNLCLSKFISNYEIENSVKNQALAVLIIVAPAILSYYQSETGLALVFASLMIVLYREGLSIIYIFFVVYIALLIVSAFAVSTKTFTIILILLGLMLLWVFRKKILKNLFITSICTLLLLFTWYMQHKGTKLILHKALASYQLKRIYSTFGIADNEKSLLERKKNNYNVIQSIVAIGSGGFWGKGFLNNTQTRLDFVPEQSTDFIICSYAESFGFVGICILLGLYFIYLWQTLSIAERQRNVFSRCYLYGIVSFILFHVTINIGMTIGMVPVIGIPLPFISYGGGAMLAFSILFFIGIRLDMDKQTVVK